MCKKLYTYIYRESKFYFFLMPCVSYTGTSQKHMIETGVHDGGRRARQHSETIIHMPMSNYVPQKHESPSSDHAT